MTSPEKILAGRRLLVVGASSGIGRAVARAAALRGARVALAARRADRLQEVAREVGGVAVAADVRRPEECERLVAESCASLGGLDGLVYASGVTPLVWLADADGPHWREVFETNLFGAALVTRAALPHLGPGSVAAYLSSDSVGRPRQGLVAYSASKAALDEVLRGLRREHPQQRFLRVVIGPTLGTEAGRGYDPDLTRDLLARWAAHGFLTERYLEAEDLGVLLAEVLATCLAHPDVAVDDLRLEPTGPLRERLEEGKKARS